MTRSTTCPHFGCAKNHQNLQELLFCFNISAWPYGRWWLQKCLVWQKGSGMTRKGLIFVNSSIYRFLTDTEVIDGAQNTRIFSFKLLLTQQAGTASCCDFWLQSVAIFISLFLTLICHFSAFSMCWFGACWVWYFDSTFCVCCITNYRFLIWLSKLELRGKKSRPVQNNRIFKI